MEAMNHLSRKRMGENKLKIEGKPTGASNGSVCVGLEKPQAGNLFEDALR